MGGLRIVVAALVAWTAIVEAAPNPTIVYRVQIDPIQNAYIVQTLLSNLDTRIRGIQGGFSAPPYPEVSLDDVLIDSHFQLHTGAVTYISISLDGDAVEPGTEGVLLSFKYGPSIDVLEGQQVCPLSNLIIGDDDAQNIVGDVTYTPCLVLPPISFTSCPVTFANGDLDLNGALAVTDIVQMSLLTLESEEPLDVCTTTIADFNIDGVVDVLDIITGIVKILNE